MLSLPHRDVASLFYEVLSEFSNVASTNNSWFVTGRGSWGVELKLPLTVSVLFCSCLCYFNAGDSSSISPAPWHSAVPLTPPLFSEAMCLQFLLFSIFEVYSWWGFLDPKRTEQWRGRLPIPNNALLNGQSLYVPVCSTGHLGKCDDAHTSQ